MFLPTSVTTSTNYVSQSPATTTWFCPRESADATDRRRTALRHNLGHFLWWSCTTYRIGSRTDRLTHSGGGPRRCLKTNQSISSTKETASVDITALFVQTNPDNQCGIIADYIHYICEPQRAPHVLWKCDFVTDSLLLLKLLWRAYKVAICPRGNLLYKKIFMNNRRIGALMYPF